MIEISALEIAKEYAFSAAIPMTIVVIGYFLKGVLQSWKG